ncbi:MAG: hypothetical protein LBC39_00380 [Methanobrevibacter sp.]|nr:hypothetical protein [Candidatus Methanovirga aequatorialis]
MRKVVGCLLLILFMSMNFVSADIVDYNKHEVDDDGVAYTIDSNCTSSVVNTISSVGASSTFTPVFLVISKNLNDYSPSYIKKSGVTCVIINARCSGISQSKIDEFVNAGLTVRFYAPCFYDPDTGKWDMDYGRARDRVYWYLHPLNQYNNVEGFVLDYIRSPGPYTNNQYLVSDLVHEVGGNYRSQGKKMSAFIMPESGGAETYGQNIGWMSETLDSLMVMAYKGNYRRDSNWIKDINAYFVQFGGCVINIVQSYRSDSDTTALGRSELYHDMDQGLYAGAYGTGLFRAGLNSLDQNNPYKPRTN